MNPPSYVTKELISNSFNISINKLEDIPPTSDRTKGSIFGCKRRIR